MRSPDYHRPWLALSAASVAIVGYRWTGSPLWFLLALVAADLLWGQGIAAQP